MKWNVEKMELLNQNKTCVGGKGIYTQEVICTKEEKIKFIDEMKDDRMTYLLNLIDKFNKDKVDLPKDKWGHVKTVSLKAWLKRNDTLKLVDDWYHYGKIKFLNIGKYIQCIDNKLESYSNIINTCFHATLIECESAERKYFLEHDEYSILKEKFRNKNYDTTFGVHIATCSNGDIYVCETNDFEPKRKITIDELKLLLTKYDELDKMVEKIAQEIDIKY